MESGKRAGDSRGFPGRGDAGGDQAVGGAGPGGPRGGRSVRGGRDVHDEPRLRRTGEVGPGPGPVRVDPGDRHQRGERQRGHGPARRRQCPMHRRASPPRRMGCAADQVLVASTGVIGHQLPMEKVEAGLWKQALAAASPDVPMGSRPFLECDPDDRHPSQGRFSPALDRRSRRDAVLEWPRVRR